MHDPNSQGNDFFRCDFCGSGWTEDRPMVEGHRGSLICSACLTVAYAHVVHALAGEPLAAGQTCTLCLEARKDPCWHSPATGAAACLRCIKQSSTVFEKDKDTPWRRPEAPRAT